MSNSNGARDKRIANATLTASAGLASMIVALQFIEIPKIGWLGALFLIIGLVAYGIAVSQWKKL